MSVVSNYGPRGVQGRAVFLRNKNREKLLSQLAIDTDRNQTEFEPNK